MGRPLLAILLIANLLVCPLRCFSCQTEAVADDNCSGEVCCCCQLADDVNQPIDGDHLPSEDCSCPDCICEGATLERGLETSQVLTQSILFVCGTDRAVIGIEHQFQCLSVGQENSSDRFISGRDARVAYQSWLI